MCGFAGFLDIGGETADRDRVVRHMAAALVHRGPDDDGHWVDDGAGLALGFRRLSIMDLSPAGHQPMMSGDGRWVVVFNGEIYNHAVLRTRLDGVSWRGHSDTEVLLEAVARWGVERAVAQFDGMFAFALWDRLERQLHLVRDRFGEKPLYWAQVGGVLMFASELKALCRHPAFDPELNRDAVASFLRLGWIPAPASIYRHAAKLPPGGMVVAGARQVTQASYWQAADRARTQAGTFTGGRAAAAERLNQLLRGAVSLRMQADVPVGVFLSGGIDSSLIAGIMQDLSGPPVHSFTIGFDQAGYDESAHAAKVAAHLGTRHQEIRITDDDALALVPDLPHVWDEPFADPAQLPTLLLSQAARRQVTVVLSGDGADELFGGYGIYRTLPNQWAKLAQMPCWLRGLGGGLGQVPAGPLNMMAGLAGLVGRKRRSYPGFRLRRLGEGLGAASLADLHGLHYARWRGMRPPVRGMRSWAVGALAHADGLADPALAAMVLDAQSYLPDDLCVKTDRATMGCSLEARLPFLDHTIAEFAWGLPTEFKIDGAVGKAVLRDVLYRYVPQSMVDRPKMGFEVPIGRWLSGRLRPWADDLLDPALLRRQGVLDPGMVSTLWQDHRNGRKNWQTELWHLLILQSWLGRRGDSATP